MKYVERAVVIEQRELIPGVYSLWLQAPRIAAEAGAGQFVSVYCRDESRMLPRPISLCEIDAAGGSIRLVYRVAGAGTSEFAGLNAGDMLRISGPLGNGFDVGAGYERVFLIGGGVGIPPMVELSKSLSCRKYIIAGYRDDKLFLTDELRANGELYIATEDGSVGTKGNVLDAMRANGLEADAVYACGPKPMLRALKEYAADHCIDCFLSLEERMACGVGACLACVCRTSKADDHTRVHNSRVCADGPVFRAEDIEL